MYVTDSVNHLVASEDVIFIITVSKKVELILHKIC